MTKIKTQSDKPHRIAFKNEGLFIDDKFIQSSCVEVSQGHFLLKTGDQSIHFTIVKQLDEGKRWVILLKGQEYELKVEDRFDAFLETIGAESEQSSAKELKAPMPGRVLDVLVKEGQEIEAGEAMIILEAMKMENVLSSDTQVEVKTVEVKTGDSVEKGDILITFE